MSSIFTTQEISQPSADLRAAGLKARTVGIFYVLTFLAGGLFLFAGGRMDPVVDLTAAVLYIAVTVLFYTITKGM
jgi:hypothetical protein